MYPIYTLLIQICILLFMQYVLQLCLHWQVKTLWFDLLLWELRLFFIHVFSYYLFYFFLKIFYYFVQLSILVSQQLLPVVMGDVYPIITAVITTMTVETIAMKLAAYSELVTPTQNSLAIMEGVYLFSMSAME